MIAVDLGNNTYSFGCYFECKPGQRVLMSGHLGSIGFFFPAAMGAQAAVQREPCYAGRPVVSVSGEWQVWQTSLRNPSFAQFAELCGSKGITVTALDDIAPAMQAALAHEGPVIVEFLTDAQLV